VLGDGLQEPTASRGVGDPLRTIGDPTRGVPDEFARGVAIPRHLVGIHQRQRRQRPALGLGGVMGFGDGPSFFGALTGRVDPAQAQEGAGADGERERPQGGRDPQELVGALRVGAGLAVLTQLELDLGAIGASTALAAPIALAREQIDGSSQLSEPGIGVAAAREHQAQVGPTQGFHVLERVAARRRDGVLEVLAGELPVAERHRCIRGDDPQLAGADRLRRLLELENGKSYRLHLSALDYQHGFSLQPSNINLQVVPGYEMVITVTPNQAGSYSIVCNEYCGIGHHKMVSRLYVK